MQITEVLEILLRKKDNFQPHMPTVNEAGWSDTLLCVRLTSCCQEKGSLVTQISHLRSVKALLYNSGRLNTLIIKWSLTRRITKECWLGNTLSPKIRIPKATH